MSFEIGEDCQIHESAIINVERGYLGPRSIVRAGVIIEGQTVQIGAEAYLDTRARIGGGSCFGPVAMLMAGDWLHMGVDSHINIARPVSIGDEVGIGIETKIFTHGAYLPVSDGFPAQWAPVYIGNRVWLPKAWVNPGVTIGDDVVVSAMSLVNKDLPSGCLAGGIPVKILDDKAYPRELSRAEIDEVFRKIFDEASIYDVTNTHRYASYGKGTYFVDGTTMFEIDTRRIDGVATLFSELLKNQLRRNGIRFRYTAKDGVYVPW